MTSEARERGPSRARSTVDAPPGAEDWRRLYPDYYLFSDERTRVRGEQFWFFDGMHNPEPIYPFDAIMPESWWVFLNQYLTRVWLVPPALGIDQRLVNGYLYVSPTTISDPAEIEERVPVFLERAGYYYENWDEIYDKWIAKAEDCIDRLREIDLRASSRGRADRDRDQRRRLTTGWDLWPRTSDCSRTCTRWRVTQEPAAIFVRTRLGTSLAERRDPAEGRRARELGLDELADDTSV